MNIFYINRNWSDGEGYTHNEMRESEAFYFQRKNAQARADALNEEVKKRFVAETSSLQRATISRARRARREWDALKAAGLAREKRPEVPKLVIPDFNRDAAHSIGAYFYEVEEHEVEDEPAGAGENA